MTTRWLVLGVIVLAAGTAIVYGLRRKDHVQAGSGALWGWIGEAQHEASRVPAAATRLTDEEEIRIGDCLAEWQTSRTQTLPADIEWSRTVDEIGERVAAHARRRLPYRFHYVPQDHFFNAYALPGGHVVFGKGLALALDTDDELAAILGHEIAHVDRYHCAERAQLEAASRSIPLGGLLTLPAALFKAGYTKDQELEADRYGTTLAVEAGYSPLGAVHAMQVLAKHQPRADRRASNPIQESGDAGLDSVQEYFKSHPDPALRLQAIEALIRSQGWLPSPERTLAHGS